MISIALFAIATAIELNAEVKEATLAEETKATVEISATGALSATSDPVVTTTGAPAAAAATDAAAAEASWPSSTAAPVPAEPVKEDKENREIETTAGSGFAVEKSTSSFMSNLGSVRDLIKQAKDLGSDSDKWPGLTTELKAIAEMADAEISKSEGMVFSQKFLSGFQSAEVIFPLLKFKATKELDTVPITSIVRTQELEMALDSVVDVAMDIASQSKNLGEAGDLLDEETTRIRDLDSGESWMKKKDVKGLVKLYNDFLAKAANDTEITDKDLIEDLNHSITDASSQMYGTLHWDAVVGLSLSLNISMDFENTLAKGGDIPEDIVKEGQKLQFGQFAMTVYSAPDSASFKKAVEDFVPQCTVFGDVLDAKLKELQDKVDDEAAKKGAAAVDNLKGDLAELTDELDELLMKVNEGDSVTTGDAAEWLLGEMENALSMQESDIIDHSEEDMY